MDRLAIVVPCYNEEAVLEETIRQLAGVLKDLEEKEKVSGDSYMMLVSDGSTDRTWELIKKGCRESGCIRGIKLAANAGHQNALLAGLMKAKEDADICISVDADLQDDLAVMEAMVDKHAAGCDIVYGVRSDRRSDTWFKRSTAQGFYRVMQLMGVKTVYNHADYRLMSKRALAHLERYQERNLFLRGIVPLIGYRSDSVYYERKERFAGESKYPVRKMIGFAFDGITSFSTRPMAFIMLLGMLIAAATVVAAVYAFLSYARGSVVPGWTSLILSLWFLGGLILFSLGLIGQYIGKIYIEVKGRPRYNIEETIGHGPEPPAK